MGRRRPPAGSLAEGDQVRNPLIPKIHSISVLVLKSHVYMCLDPILLPHPQVSPFLAFDRPRQHICGVAVQSVCFCGIFGGQVASGDPPKDPCGPAGSLAEGDQVRHPPVPKTHFLSVVVLTPYVFS